MFVFCRKNGLAILKREKAMKLENVDGLEEHRTALAKMRLVRDKQKQRAYAKGRKQKNASGKVT